MKNNSRFVQLAIPGTEQFFAENPKSVETTATILKAIEDIAVLSSTNQNTFEQLVIPGLEEFFVTQSKPTNLNEFSDNISIKASNLENFAA